jgi:hypothetical protein
MVKRRLYMIRYFLLVLTIALFSVSCTKQKQAKWMYYQETICADKWEYTINNEKLKDNVVAYLQTKGVTVYEMEIFRIGEPETCSACTCKTGRRYKLKVKKSDVSDAKSEGLYE